ncbi:4-coumarate--CoA ligase 1-like isoform X2 [Pseudomyrmex gracilis]|uniref:4-coumarate--CoA ligase 1-like isoform X2 n=1 Tax=Pseudomyrmex gracilis TaxID=219809 RepID=UPI000994CE2D|nr:4-coumarate--CoA ligase 1-like isoform X2 [Pseudomyrmex gracilis]
MVGPHRFGTCETNECSITGRSYTYGQLRKACSKLATSLRKNNLLPGDKIAIVLPNIPEFVIVLLAAHEAGLCTVLISPAGTVYEIRRQIKDTDVRAIFTNSVKCADVQASIETNSHIKLPIIVANDGTESASIPGTIDLNDLIRDDIEDFNKKCDVTAEDTVVLAFSSGTTGLPKAVETRHRNIVVNILQRTHPMLFPALEATKYHQEIVPLILPAYHFFALALTLYCYLRIGAKIVCLPYFVKDNFIRLLENHKCTTLQAVPPIIQMMANDERVTSRHVESMKDVVLGGAPFGNESISMFLSRVGDVPIVQGYGMTELSPIASIGTPRVPKTSVGYLVANTQMRIASIDDPGRNLGPNEIGELCIRGPQVMKGYYKNAQATADTMDGDWLKTGDLGYYSENGLLYFHARLKELIKVKGHQVAPIELEEIIRGHDKVQDVAVIGVAHDKYGEIPKAFVVPKPGAKIDENELKHFVAKHVSKYKQLGYVQIVESIPKTMSGKILRKELRKM